MKLMHILGGTKPRRNERKLEADYEGGIGVFSYSGGLFLRGSVGERDVEVALDLDLLDEDSVQFFPLLFDDGPIELMIPSEEDHISVELRLIDKGGKNLFEGMTADRLCGLLTAYCGLFGREMINPFHLRGALCYELLNPGRMSEYEDHWVGFFYKSEADSVAKLFPDLSLEEIEQRLKDNPNSLSNRDYTCYEASENDVIVFRNRGQ